MSSSSKSTRKSKSKYIFKLYGIDLMKINFKYGINVSSNIPSSSNVHPLNTTDLSSLRDVMRLKQKDSTKITFLDESKRLRACTLAYADFVSITILRSCFAYYGQSVKRRLQFD